jgi:CHAT domain-containing protein/tetratricopeptide (TPR) repeat protein
LFKLEQYSKSKSTYQELLEIIVESNVGNTDIGKRLKSVLIDPEVETLMNLSVVSYFLGELDQEKIFYQKAVEVSEKFHPYSREKYNICVECRITAIYGYVRGNHEKEIFYWNIARNKAHKRGDYDHEAAVLNTMGNIYMSVGPFSKAALSYKDMINLFKQRKTSSSDPSVLMKLGKAYYFEASYSDALSLYQASMSLTKDNSEKFEILIGTGDLYQRIGQFDKAIEIYLQADKINKIRQGDAKSNIDNGTSNKFSQHIKTEAGMSSINTPLVLQRLGLLYQALADSETAIRFYNRSLVKVEDNQAIWAGSWAGSLYGMEDDYPVLQEAATLDYLGLAYQSLGQLEEGIKLHRKALQLFHKLQLPASKARVLGHLGNAYSSQGDLNRANYYHQQAVSIQQRIGDREGEAKTVADFANIFAKQNQPELAIALYKKSVSIYEDIRKGLTPLPQDQQQSYADTVAKTYRELADLLLKNNRILEARQIIELLKLQELEDYSRNTRGKVSALSFLRAEEALLKSFDQQVNQSTSIIQLIQEYEKQRDQPASTRGSSDQELATLEDLKIKVERQTITFLNQPEVKSLIEKLKSKDEVIALEEANIKILQGNLKTLAQSQQKAALIYPLIFDNRLEILLITPNAILRRTVNTFDRVEFNQLIATMGRDLKDPQSDPKPTAQKLYQILIAPIEADLQAGQINTLIYSPDRRLRSIPIAALHDGEQWLAERFQISQITASAATNLTSLPSTQPKVLAGAISSDSSKSYNVQIPNDNKSHSFRGLPAVEPEVKGIQAILPGSEILLDSAFISDRIRNRPSQFTILHFATHGLSQIDRPEQSFILFGGPDRQGRNYATLQDIKDWNISGEVDLVTLSACETAVVPEKLDSQLGIMGLGYQFQSAGAKSVLATLWTVNDASTAIIMQYFYRYIAQGKSKAAALQLAQRDLLKIQDTPSKDKAIADLTRFKNPIDNAPKTRSQPKPVTLEGYSHPYYWAPFILIGNSR